MHLILMFMLLFETSCEAYLYINVSVNDASSKKPIKNAMVHLIDGDGNKSRSYTVNNDGKIDDSILVAFSKKRSVEIWIEAPSYNKLVIKDKLYNWTKDSNRIFVLEPLR